MQRIAVCGKSGTGKSTTRNLKARLSALYKSTLRAGSDLKVERTRLLPGGQTQAIVPDTITRFSGKGASCILIPVEKTLDVSGTPNLVVPNRVLGAVFTT